MSTADAERTIISNEELDRLTAQTFQDAQNQMAKAVEKGAAGETRKLFGILDVPEYIAIPAEVAYNNLASVATDIIAPQAYEVTRRLGKAANQHLPGVKLSNNVIGKTGAIASLGVAIFLKSAMHTLPVIKTLVKERKEQLHTARRLAVPLESLHPRMHALVGYLATGIDTNTMIYAHKKHVGKKYKMHHFNNLTDLVVQGGTNILLDMKQFGRMWKEGKSPDELQLMDYERQIQKAEQEEKAAKKAEREAAKKKKTAEPVQPVMTAAEMLKAQREERADILKKNVKMAANTGSTVIAKAMQASNIKKLAAMRAFTAVDMVLELAEQVGTKADARSFSTPKVEGQSSQNLGLEEYIAQTIKLHQKEMADLSPDHMEIRDALTEDLIAAVKPIAAAIRKGEVSAIALVELVGDPKRGIIKDKGRGIATTEEVKDLLEEIAGNHNKPLDTKELLSKSGITHAQFAKALEIVEGEDRQLLISWIPSSNRKDLGISEDESKQVDEAIGNDYNRHLAEYILGLNAKSDEELKKEGVPHSGIRLIRRGAGKIAEYGIEAVQELKTSPIKKDGIEPMLLGCAVTNIINDPKHLGTVIASGRDLLDKEQLEAANDEEKPTKRVHAAKAEKYGQSRSGNDNYADAANDEAPRGKHRKREDHRRASGHDMEFDRGEF